MDLLALKYKYNYLVIICKMVELATILKYKIMTSFRMKHKTISLSPPGHMDIYYLNRYTLVVKGQSSDNRKNINKTASRCVMPAAIAVKRGEIINLHIHQQKFGLMLFILAFI